MMKNTRRRIPFFDMCFDSVFLIRYMLAKEITWAWKLIFTQDINNSKGWFREYMLNASLCDPSERNFMNGLIAASKVYNWNAKTIIPDYEKDTDGTIIIDKDIADYACLIMMIIEERTNMRRVRCNMHYKMNFRVQKSIYENEIPREKLVIKRDLSF
jgi:hypothetical protein